MQLLKHGLETPAQERPCGAHSFSMPVADNFPISAIGAVPAPAWQKDRRRPEPKGLSVGHCNLQPNIIAVCAGAPAGPCGL